MVSNSSRKAAIITLFAETHIHVGVGQTTGALDLPVARERTTQFPFVPGSGVKGAFRVWATEQASELNVRELFGKSVDDTGGLDGAGALLCSDARLLLLPVRCLSDNYKWVTCPTILRRLRRDVTRAGYGGASFETPEPNDGEFFGAGERGVYLGLEEREILNSGSIDDTLISEITSMVGIEIGARLNERLVVLSDKDFVWFAQYALPVMARNALDENKTSVALWYEESLAPDTVMYVLLGQRSEGSVAAITKAITSSKYIQVGGNETIGQGWFQMLAHDGEQN